MAWPKQALLFVGSCFFLYRMLWHAGSAKELIVVKSISTPENLIFQCSPSVMILLSLYLVVRAARNLRQLEWRNLKAIGDIALDAASIFLLVVVLLSIPVTMAPIFSATMRGGTVWLEYSYRYLLTPLIASFAVLSGWRMVRLMHPQDG